MQPNDRKLSKAEQKEQWMRQMIQSLAQDVDTLSRQVVSLARAGKITPEEFVKTVSETGANMAFYQNCMLIEKRLQEEAKEKALKAEPTEEVKETIEKIAIK